MSMPAWGLRSSRMEMSWRSTSMQTVSSCAVAVVWCGVCSSMEAKPKNSPVSGLIHDDLLIVFVHGGDADGAGDEDVGAVAGVADFVDALAGREIADFDLGGEDGGFFVVEQGEERDLAQDFGVGGHGFLRAWVCQERMAQVVRADKRPAKFFTTGAPRSESNFLAFVPVILRGRRG